MTSPSCTMPAMEARNEKSRTLFGDGLCGKRTVRLLPGGLPFPAVLDHRGKSVQTCEQHLCEVDGLRDVFDVSVFTMCSVVADQPDFSSPRLKGGNNQGPVLGISNLVDEPTPLGSNIVKRHLKGVAGIGGSAGKHVRVVASKDFQRGPVKFRNLLRCAFGSFSRSNRRVHCLQHAHTVTYATGMNFFFADNPPVTMPTFPKRRFSSPAREMMPVLDSNIPCATVRALGESYGFKH